MKEQPDIFVQDSYKNTIPNDLRLLFILNPLLAVEYFFGFELSFFQITRLHEIWEKTSYMDNSGYGTGKTFGIAVVKALRAILLPNRVQMMISHTFGGVKLLFDTYLEPWFYEFPRYADQFAIGTKNPVSKTSELYSVKLANGNSIRGVPPGILTGSTRLRSERCNDISLDEWAHYHSQEEIDTVIKSRATRYNPYHKFKAKTSNEIRLKNILSNHKCFLSTPNYKFHPSFKRAKFFVQKAHVDKSPNYGFETYSYLDLMDDGREDLTDIEAIEESKAMLPNDLFLRDYEGEWVSGSVGYYNYDLVMSVRSTLNKPMLKGTQGDVYIKGVDVARSIRGKGDDFAITVIKFNPKEGFNHEFVYQVTKNNLDADQMAVEIHDVDEMFPGPIWVDPGGGGQFLLGPLGKHIIPVPTGTRKVTPIYDADSAEVGGKNVLHWFSRGTLIVKEIMGKMSGDDVLVNNAHAILKNFLEKGKINIPYSEDISLYFTKVFDKDVRGKDNLKARLEPLEQLYFNIELTMMQLQGVEQKIDKQTGKPALTSRGQFTFTSTRKKDSAYSFLYAIFGTYIYEEMLKRQEMGDKNDLGQVISQELDLSDNITIPSIPKKEEEQTYEEEGIFSFSAH